MPYVRKSMPRKRPAVKRKMSRRKPVSRRPRTIRIADPTVIKLNPGKARVQRWIKTTPVNVPGVPSFPGTNGFSITLSGAAYNQSGSMTFDPSGNFGNFSGPITNANPFSGLSASALPEWISLQNLYAQYKVNKITLKFSCQQVTTSANFTAPTLYMRYNDEYIPGAPTAVSISEEKNWIKKTFTAESPTFQYSFYPKVWALYDNLGAITTDARVTRSMPWTNMSSPVELAGMKFYVQAQATSAAATNYIQCDVQYDISFKEQT